MRHRALALLAALTALALAACASAPSGGAGSCPVFELAAQNPAPALSAQPLALCPQPTTYPFTNLVFKGGGVKGVAYGGALDVLERQGILESVGPVAGTSAGAITAALVALRYSPAEIKSLVSNIDFSRFEDGGSTGLFRIFRRFGWFEGDYFLDLMRCLVEHQTKKPRSTFADLRDLGFRDLHVFSTDLSAGVSKEFSAGTTPDVEVALAVRMSMSIPLFFASVEFQDDVFVDGGVLRNYPIDAFDERSRIDPATLGLFLTHGPPSPVKIRRLLPYSRRLFETLLDVQVADLETNLPDLERSVLLDDLGISTTDFGLTDQQKNALMDKGAECTCRYLSDWQTWQRQGASPADALEAPGLATRLDTSRKCGSVFGPTGGAVSGR